MRVDHSSRQITLAAFLLCLLGAFSSGGLDYFCRTSAGGARARTVRAQRLDDHDQDHALEVPELISDSLSDHGGSGDGDHHPQAAIPAANLPQPLFVTFGAFVPHAFAGIPRAPISSLFGRPPPSFS
jgi:hypothetical protein